MLWAHEVGVRRLIKAGERLEGEPAGNARIPHHAPNGDLDAARAWAVARTFGSASVAPVLLLCRQYLPEANAASPSATAR